MAQQNRAQRRKDAKAKARLNAQLQIHLQFAMDAALIAANDVLHCGPGRAEEYTNAFGETYLEIVKAFDDGADYAFEIIDRRLRPICGEKFQPWGVRYGGRF